MFKKSKFGSIFFFKEVRFLYSKGGTEKCLGILVRCTISCGLRSSIKVKPDRSNRRDKVGRRGESSALGGAYCTLDVNDFGGGRQMWYSCCRPDVTAAL
jgi:hypothetical protein